MTYKEEGKIIFLFGSKGGCGSTFVSINIANYFASFTNKNVLFLDLNPNREDLRYIFRIDHRFEKNISDLEDIINDLDLSVLKKTIFNLEHSLNILLPGIKMTRLDHLLKLLELMRTYYDLILVDFPILLYGTAAFTKIRYIDKFILITLPEMLPLINLDAIIQKLNELDCLDKTSLIANKCNQLNQISFINRLIRFPIELFLCYDKDIERLFLSGKPQMVFKYNLKITKSLKSFAGKILSEISGDCLE
jgi:cellulose biosynthesis protein BcsQ